MASTALVACPRRQSSAAQFRPGPGLIEESQRVEADVVEFQEIAVIAMEGEPAPRLATQPHRGMSLDTRHDAHRFSN